LLAKPAFRAVASNLLQTIALVPLFVALHRHKHPANRVTGGNSWGIDMVFAEHPIVKDQ
jgi:hypothetical protein